MDLEKAAFVGEQKGGTEGGESERKIEQFRCLTVKVREGGALASLAKEARAWWRGIEAGFPGPPMRLAVPHPYCDI